MRTNLFDSIMPLIIAGAVLVLFWAGAVFFLAGVFKPILEAFK